MAEAFTQAEIEAAREFRRQFQLGEFHPDAPEAERLLYDGPQTAPESPTRPNGHANGEFNGHDLAPPEGPITGAQLDTQAFPPVEWIIEGVLPTGLALLAGKGKIGKSWLAMDISVAVANGQPVFGKIATKQCDVLYLALEDSRRRLQFRMRLMLGTTEAPDNLTFATEWPTVDQGCLEAIEHWIKTHPTTRLVIVDIFAKVRGRPDGRTGVYQQDHRDVSAFHQLAQRLNIALILIHHTRKQDATDVMDLISGTTGISGGADTLIVLQRKRGEEAGTLSITGRDIIEDGEFALTFHKDTAKWEWLGEAKQVKTDTLQSQIYNFLRNEAEPAGPTDIANELEISLNTVKSALRRMKKAGSIVNPTEGIWTVSGPREQKEPT